MGFFDLFRRPPTIEEQHEQNPTLCFPHLAWNRREEEGDDVWWLGCCQCNATFLKTYRDADTGQLKYRTSSHWWMLNHKSSNAFVHHEDTLRQMFYTQFPNADELSAEHAEKAQAAIQARIAQYNAEDEVRRQENLAKPHCPTCNSTDVQPISNVKRIASTAVMGIASSTIGKSYECKKCGYKW